MGQDYNVAYHSDLDPVLFCIVFGRLDVLEGRCLGLSVGLRKVTEYPKGFV